jgi:hypothetical protein
VKPIDPSKLMTSASARLTLICATVTFVWGCGLLTNGSVVEVIDENDHIESINMAPRHYRVQEQCHLAIKSARHNILKAMSHLDPAQRTTLESFRTLQSLRATDCDSFRKRGDIMSKLDSIYSDHKNLIGIILPPTTTNELAVQTILDQLRQTLGELGISQPEKRLLIRRVAKNESDVLKTASELSYIHGVSLLLTTNSYHAKVLSGFSDLSQVPIMVINPQDSRTKTTQSTRIYPRWDILAKKLTDEIARLGATHATIMYPKGADLDFAQELKKSKSLIFMESSYDPTSPTTLLSDIKSASARMAFIRSRAQAVIILDNFKMVRHIVNMLRPTAASQQTLLFAGNQQWRSPALVTPKEDALQGAVFGDFIGSYDQLPPSLKVATTEGPFFAPIQIANKLDYQLIGYRIGSLAVDVFSHRWSRQQITRNLLQTINHWDDYFPAHAPAFDENRASNWPTFLFRVQDETIIPVAEI